MPTNISRLRSLELAFALDRQREREREREREGEEGQRESDVSARRSEEVSPYDLLFTYLVFIWRRAAK